MLWGKKTSVSIEICDKMFVKTFTKLNKRVRERGENEAGGYVNERLILKTYGE